ncbi:MAG: hypothetical protein QM488_12750 [Rhizobiaceae bacterium]
MARPHRVAAVTQDAFGNVVKVVMPFGAKLKARMKHLKKVYVRVACPDHPEHYIHARLLGKKDHLHMGCEIPNCRYRLME